MSRLESAQHIEKIVGAKRHATQHLGRAVSAKERLYILHSKECAATAIDLRECPYSVALDLGIDLGLWKYEQDRVVVLAICPDGEDLIPQLVELVEDESWS